MNLAASGTFWARMNTSISEAHALVAAVREAARRHGIAWATMIPDPHSFNAAAEAHEEAAFQDMAEAKAALRRHICDTYGLSPRELASLATV